MLIVLIFDICSFPGAKKKRRSRFSATLSCVWRGYIALPQNACSTLLARGERWAGQKPAVHIPLAVLCLETKFGRVARSRLTRLVSPDNQANALDLWFWLFLNLVIFIIDDPPATFVAPWRLLAVRAGRTGNR